MVAFAPVAPEKDISVFLYWVMLWLLGMLCEIIPPFKDHKEWMNWIPMLCVGVIHNLSVFMGFADTWTFFDDDPHGHYDDDAAPGSGGGPKYPRKKRLPRCY